MENLTKSMLSLPWATFLFSIKQTSTLLNRQSSGQSTEETANAFTNSAKDIEKQLRGQFETTFKAGDQLQQRMADMISSMLTFSLRR